MTAMGYERIQALGVSPFWRAYQLVPGNVHPRAKICGRTDMFTIRPRETWRCSDDFAVTRSDDLPV